MKHWEPVWSKQGLTAVVGIDEAGRGPLAGPVVAAAVYLPPYAVIPGLRDSKKMTSRQRQQVYAQILDMGIAAVAEVAAAEIDRLNILQASLLAMARAAAKLPFRPDLCLVDGNQIMQGWPGRQEAVIGGDNRYLAVAAASVIAKVTRDEQMVRWHDRYPQYGFARHKGYPTKQHQDALARFGPCPIHRRSFAGVCGQQRLPTCEEFRDGKPRTRDEFK